MNSFEEIYAENYRTMFRVAARMVGNIEDVSDILQEIFIDFFNKTSSGKIIQHPKSWLYRATVNKCIDNHRSKKNLQDLDSAGSIQTGTELVEARELNEIILIAFSKLKPEEKLLATVYSEGLSYKEISEVTGIKFSSVGKTLSRTLKKMEIELKKQKYELY